LFTHLFHKPCNPYCILIYFLWRDINSIDFAVSKNCWMMTSCEVQPSYSYPSALHTTKWLIFLSVRAQSCLISWAWKIIMFLRTTNERDCTRLSYLISQHGPYFRWVWIGYKELSFSNRRHYKVSKLQSFGNYYSQPTTKPTRCLARDAETVSTSPPNWRKSIY